VLAFSRLRASSQHGSARIQSATESGDANSGEIVSTSVMENDGGVFDIVSLSIHRRCSPRHLAPPASGQTLDLGLPDRMIGSFGAIFPLGASFLSRF
jgi:hypothetical protein